MNFEYCYVNFFSYVFFNYLLCPKFTFIKWKIFMLSITLLEQKEWMFTKHIDQLNTEGHAIDDL